MAYTVGPTEEQEYPDFIQNMPTSHYLQHASRAQQAFSMLPTVYDYDQRPSIVFFLEIVYNLAHIEENLYNCRPIIRNGIHRRNYDTTRVTNLEIPSSR